MYRITHLMMHFHVEVKMQHGCDQQSRANPFHHESTFIFLQYYPPIHLVMKVVPTTKVTLPHTLGRVHLSGTRLLLNKRTPHQTNACHDDIGVNAHKI